MCDGVRLAPRALSDCNAYGQEHLLNALDHLRILEDQANAGTIRGEWEIETRWSAFWLAIDEAKLNGDVFYPGPLGIPLCRKLTEADVSDIQSKLKLSFDRARLAAAYEELILKELGLKVDLK